MGRKKNTPEEEKAFDDLAAAAARLREIQEATRSQRERREEKAPLDVVSVAPGEATPA